MSQICRQLSRRQRIHRRVLLSLQHYIQSVLDRMFMCCIGKSRMYRVLPRRASSVTSSPTPVTTTSATPEADIRLSPDSVIPACRNHDSSDSNLVTLKISLLGDCDIGKTSFLVKYVGNESGDEGQECHSPSLEKGFNLMDKTLLVGGARISYCIWEVGADKRSQDHIPTACKDSVAILFMFDLTCRGTLNSVLRWYKQARKWNQTAIPILIGTKFDDFIQLPIDLQWTIASQAREYAKAMNATLFFSSAMYNINVNKIFKFITAKLFDLPWTVERNVAIGEPIIDF